MMRPKPPSPPPFLLLLGMKAVLLLLLLLLNGTEQRKNGAMNEASKERPQTGAAAPPRSRIRKSIDSNHNEFNEANDNFFSDPKYLPKLNLGFNRNRETRKRKID